MASDESHHTQTMMPGGLKRGSALANRQQTSSSRLQPITGAIT